MLFAPNRYQNPYLPFPNVPPTFVSNRHQNPLLPSHNYSKWPLDFPPILTTKFYALQITKNALKFTRKTDTFAQFCETRNRVGANQTRAKNSSDARIYYAVYRERQEKKIISNKNAERHWPFLCTIIHLGAAFYRRAAQKLIPNFPLGISLQWLQNWSWIRVSVVAS